jgi:hypothetical protein
VGQPGPTAATAAGSAAPKCDARDHDEAHDKEAKDQEERQVPAAPVLHGAWPGHGLNVSGVHMCVCVYGRGVCVPWGLAGPVEGVPLRSPCRTFSSSSLPPQQPMAVGGWGRFGRGSAHETGTEDGPRASCSGGQQHNRPEAREAALLAAGAVA